MIRIVVDDKILFIKGILEPFADVIYVPGHQINREVLMNADALLIRTRTKCTRELLEGTGVRFIGSATIGFDHIDAHFCEKENIKWTNTPGCNSSSVQQYIATALFTMAKKQNFILKDKTIGIIGVGNVGSKVEKFARNIGMKVMLNDPPREKKEGGNKFVPLDELLMESDIITIHVPLNCVGEDKTYHLIDYSILKKIGNGSWLLNTSRGEVADTPVLKKGIREGKLAGVIIDVWENEPDIDHQLMKNAFIATPHIAGYSTDGKANGTSMVVKALSDFFDLPLVNWYPSDLPEPANSLISIEGNGKSTEDILREAVTSTYNIIEDDRMLRTSPSDFEKQRGNYPVRREFPFYKLSLTNCPSVVSDILKNLGFSLLNN